MQYYPAGCVTWVPRLILWDLPTNQTERMHSQNRTHLYVGELLEMEGNIILSTQDSLDPGFKLFTPSPLSVCLTPSQLTWSSESQSSESESLSDVSDSLRPHGLSMEFSKARILEWVAFPFSRGSSPRSPALQADSLPTKLSGPVSQSKPLNRTGLSVSNAVSSLWKIHSYS